MGNLSFGEVYNQGRAAANERKWAEAAECYKKCLEIYEEKAKNETDAAFSSKYASLAAQTAYAVKRSADFSDFDAKFSEAAGYYLKAAELFSRSANREYSFNAQSGLRDAYLNAASIYETLEDMEKAAELYLKAAEAADFLAERNGDSKDYKALAQCWIRLNSICGKLGRSDSAKKYMIKSLDANIEGMRRSPYPEGIKKRYIEEQERIKERCRN